MMWRIWNPVSALDINVDSELLIICLFSRQRHEKGNHCNYIRWYGHGQAG